MRLSARASLEKMTVRVVIVAGPERLNLRERKFEHDEREKAS